MKVNYRRTINQIEKLPALKVSSGASRDVYLDANKQAVYKVDSLMCQNKQEVKLWKKYGKELTILVPILAHSKTTSWVCQPVLNNDALALRKAWKALLGSKYRSILQAVEYCTITTVEQAYKTYSTLPRKKKTRQFLKELMFLTKEEKLSDYAYLPCYRQWCVDADNNIRLCDYGYARDLSCRL